MKKVCYILTNRTQYGRSKILLKTIQEHPDLQLQIIVAGAALLSKYGNVLLEMEHDGFVVDEKITMLIEGGSPVAMAKTTGLGLIEFSTAFENLNPDIVLVRGDRYEVLSAVIAASYLNIVVGHIEGGDLSGTIDESVRHAITKLAHIHFPTNEDSAERIKRMGEFPDNINMVGSLDVEFLNYIDFESQENPFEVAQKGLGPPIDLSKDYLMVLQHPVTTEYGKGQQHFEHTIQSIQKLKIPTIWFWPNIDAGNDEVTKVIRSYRENHNMDHVHFFRSLPPEVYIRLLKQCRCLIGNSSSGIKECSYLGVPVVNVGSRQNGRLRASNVLDVPYDMDEIVRAIQFQISHGSYVSSDIYFREETSSKISNILAQKEIAVQKTWWGGP